MANAKSCKFILSTGAGGYETGSANLQPADKQLFIFCTSDVSLDPSYFHKFSRIMVVSSVDWSLLPSNIDKHHAAAVQTVVNGSSFKACAHLVGVFPNSVSLPRINWVAVQINVHFQTNHAVFAGAVKLSSNVTGASLCEKIDVQVLFSKEIHRAITLVCPFITICCFASLYISQILRIISYNEDRVSQSGSLSIACRNQSVLSP